MGDQAATKKQVKVDNWGIFFLQRLQQFFTRGEHCDLTLHFTTGEKTKVHRLVLNACTDYFQVLEKQYQPVNNVLTLPSHLHPDVVVPIINFMYTGRLEFRNDLYKQLYSTAQQMNMTVLTKLLDAQTSLPAVPSKPIPKRVTQVPITHNLQGKKIYAKNVDPDLPEPLPGRKLPIWKRRNVPANVSSYYDDSSSSMDYESKLHSQPSMEEIPKPTRFEWPDENLGSTPYTSTFDDLSYETKPIVKPCGSILNKASTSSETSRVATFEEVCRTATNVNMKRFAPSPVQDESASKKSKILDLQAVKEYAQEHRLRKDLLVTTEEHGEEVEDDLAVADMDDDDDMEDDDIDGTFESLEPKQDSASQSSDVEVNCQPRQEQPVTKQSELPTAVAPLTLSLDQKSDLTQALTQVIVQPTQMLEPQIIHITQNSQIPGVPQQLVLQAHGLPSHIQLLRTQPQVLPEAHLTVHPQLTTESKLTHENSDQQELAGDSQLSLQQQIVTQTQLTSQPHIITQAQLAAQAQLINQGQLTSQPQLVTQTQLVSQAQIVSQARLASTSQVITPEHFSSQRHIITQAQLTSQPQIVQTQMTSQPQMVAHTQLTSQAQIIAQAPLTSQPQIISQSQLASQPHIVPQSPLTSQPLILAHTQFSHSQVTTQTQLTAPSQVIPQSHLVHERKLDTIMHLTAPSLPQPQIDSKMPIRDQLQPSVKPQLALQVTSQTSQPHTPTQKQLTAKYQLATTAPFSKASDLTSTQTQLSPQPTPQTITLVQTQPSTTSHLIMPISSHAVSQAQPQVANSQPMAISQLLSPTVASNHKDSPSQAQKSILKTQTSHEEPIATTTPVSVTTKKVRFSLDAKLSEGKENAAADTIRCAEERPIPTRAESLNAVSTATVTTGNVSNHAKIISEVLKKYPHLVKNNKNIRLKIMQRGGQVTPMISPVDASASKVVKSKVSYVVLKSEVAGKGKSAVVLKHGGHVEPLSELGGQKPASGAENTTGPWLCHSCGTNEEPMRFESYYLYRRHLQYVHMEKIDARICEHCGHRASKRNLLLYHLYTKHAVPPPRNCQFPKCDQCDYVALSESLLIKHRRYHSNSREFVCKVCNATFKSNGALQGHMQTNLHSDPLKKLYECPFCQKPFVRNINLKAHIRTSHKEVIHKMNEEEKSHMQAQNKHLGDLQNLEDGDEAHSSDIVGEEEEEGQIVQVPVIGNAIVHKQAEKQVIIQPGMRVLAEAPAASQTAVASSEAEALSNVASGIAASLGLADTLSGEQTVIVLDGNPELILQSTEIVSEEVANTDGKVNSEGTITIGTEMQEYIIPEMMPEDTHENSQEHCQTYVDSLADLEHYPGGEGSTTVSVVPSAETVSNRQHSTAPPPVSVAVSVAGGGKVTMFLSDHDYAPIRDSHGEEVMFFIARPVSDENDEQCTVSGAQENQTIPVLEKEVSPPQLVAEPSHVIVSKDNYSNIPPVLTREVGTDVAVALQQDSRHENTLKQQSAMDDISASSSQQNETLQEAVSAIPESTENVQVIQRTASHTAETNENMSVLSEKTPLNTREIITEKPLRLQQKSAEQAPISAVESAKPSSPLQETKKKSTIQMADLMKEWDDFDDEESIEVISEKDIREDTP